MKDNESLWIDDTLVPLSPLQLRLLTYLCSHPQEVLDKQRIAEAVWDRGDVSDVSLARAIHGLRSRLAIGSKANELIRNVYGRGYMLTQSVTVSDDSASPTPLKPEASSDTPRTVVDRPLAAVATLPRPSLRAVR